jgi:hypothetical protein
MPATEQLLIRFRGICGHIDLTNGNGPKKKRTVLVRHQDGNDDDIEPHLSYIEFLADDVVKHPGLVTYSRPGDNARYARVDLDDSMEIRLKGIAPGLVSEQRSYLRGIPRMTEILGRKPVVRTGLRVAEAQNVPRALVSGVFDMPEGLLVGGEPEAQTTHFGNDNQFERRRLARWSDLFIEYEPPLVLQLVPLGGEGETKTITFQSSLRMITIGNEPERLIAGITEVDGAHGGDHGHGNGNGNGNGNGTPLKPTGHFKLYYNLIEDAPKDPPLPIPGQIDGVGCPNNNFP